jgi:hypothetical protein
MFAFMQAQQSEALTLSRVLRDIPHDTGAVIIYVMLVAFMVFIWLGSRSSSTPAGSDGQRETNAG